MALYVVSLFRPFLFFLRFLTFLSDINLGDIIRSLQRGISDSLGPFLLRAGTPHADKNLLQGEWDTKEVPFSLCLKHFEDQGEYGVDNDYVLHVHISLDVCVTHGKYVLVLHLSMTFF